jgi:N-acetylmuramoyl-L-alanine amidase
MKKFVSILLLMSLLFTLFASVGHAASTPPKLFLNGKELLSDVEPRIEKGSTLVPLAILSEGLGYEVEWEGGPKKVTVKNDSTVIELIINQTSIRVNGEVKEIDVTPPKLVNWRTMVPVRLVGELLGISFEWKEDVREVHMFEKAEEPKPGTETPETPAVGYITAVNMDEQSVIRISHAGANAPGKPKLLDNPRRLVIDFPYTTFIPQLANTIGADGQAKITVENNPLLTSYRYSQFSASPLTARLVVDLGDDTGYVLTSGENEFAIALMPLSEVPAQPVDPETPTEPEEPSTPEPSTPPDNSADVYDIVLDAGHGAKDPGAYSKSLNRWEKEFNLSAVLKIKAELEKDKRFRVHLTRKDDTFLELMDRVKFAENVKADLFISVHANSYDNTSVSGVETYYERANSKAFAETMHKYVLAGMGIRDRGVKKAAFKVIKETTMPAILIEAGYLSNASDASALFNTKTQDKLAVEVSKGIKDYLKLK